MADREWKCPGCGRSWKLPASFTSSRCGNCGKEGVTSVNGVWMKKAEPSASVKQAQEEPTPSIPSEASKPTAEAKRKTSSVASTLKSSKGKKLLIIVVVAIVLVCALGLTLCSREPHDIPGTYSITQMDFRYNSLDDWRTAYPHGWRAVFTEDGQFTIYNDDGDALLSGSWESCRHGLPWDRTISHELVSPNISNSYLDTGSGSWKMRVHGNNMSQITFYLGH